MIAHTNHHILMSQIFKSYYSQMWFFFSSCQRCQVFFFPYNLFIVEKKKIGNLGGLLQKKESKAEKYDLHPHPTPKSWRKLVFNGKGGKSLFFTFCFCAALVLNFPLLFCATAFRMNPCRWRLPEQDTLLFRGWC